MNKDISVKYLSIRSSVPVFCHLRGFGKKAEESVLKYINASEKPYHAPTEEELRSASGDITERAMIRQFYQWYSARLKEEGRSLESMHDETRMIEIR